MVPFRLLSDLCIWYNSGMSKVENIKSHKLKIFINRPTDEVFAYALSSENVPKWIKSIKEEIPSELPVKLGTKLKNRSFDSGEYNYYEVIDFKNGETFTLKRLNGDYHVRYTVRAKDDGTEFEYYEWTEKDALDPLDQSALVLLKKHLEK